MIKFYHDKFIADYMASNFKVEFYFNEKIKKFLILVDSYDIFKPKIGDFCEYNSKKYGWIFANISKNGALWKSSNMELVPIPDDSVFIRIRVRDGKNFFMPESMEINHY